MILTGVALILSGFSVLPPIENYSGTCTLNSVIQSRMYSDYEYYEYDWEYKRESIEMYRDFIWIEYCGDCIGTNIQYFLRRARDFGIIEGYNQVDRKQYEFTGKTIIDLQGIADNPGEGYIRKARYWERKAPAGHTVALIGDIGDYWVVYSDLSWGLNPSQGYELLSKEDWDFYILDY